MSRRSTKNKSPMKKIIALLVAVAIVALGGLFLYKTFLSPTDQASETKVAQTTQKIATTSAEEKEYLTNKFKVLLGINSDTIAYVYALGTELDEPVVQTTDNSTYLDKRFDGGHEPYMGTVFMDTDNKNDFSDRLIWLFGHARGSKVGDHRMFNDVNYYSRQDYFDEHPYVVIETPERKYYYEAVAMIIVPEETAFYRTSFDDDKDFQTQLTTIYETAEVKKPNVKVSAKNKYLVLSTCREEDETIRANLYLRQIPDSEMSEFVKQHKDQLTYKPTR